MLAKALPGAPWFKSSRSGSDSDCVEVAFLDGWVATRDSKEPDGTVLVFEAAAWQAFVSAAGSGQFDRPV